MVKPTITNGGICPLCHEAVDKTVLWVGGELQPLQVIVHRTKGVAHIISTKDNWQEYVIHFNYDKVGPKYVKVYESAQMKLI